MAGVARRAGGRFLAARGDAGGNAYFSAEAALAPGPAVDAPAGPPPPSPAASRITPAVLFVTVVLAVVLLVSGLLHVLRRLFLKTHGAGAGAGERQLQHLFFPANDDGAGGSGTGGGGLAQAAIDALPEFAYAELSAAGAAASSKGKEKAARPFDCAVCLCEFAGHDRLRLLPPCGHAFHVACIDVWLRSSATCPLCRTKLSRAAAAAAAAAGAPSAGSADAVEEDESKQQQDQQAPSAEPAGSSVVLPVRLGRFQIADDASDAAATAESSTGASTSRIDKRRCYSMGSYQYVLADEQLLVSVHVRHGSSGGAAAAFGGGDQQQQQQQQQVGRKVFARGDSFSVSKIWQWRGSRRLPGALCADDGLPWAPAAKDGGDRSAATARHQHGDT